MNLNNFFSVVDSWGKLPSGILAGHLTDLGNFDQCLGTVQESIQTRYCISKSPIARSNSSILRLGLCFPRSCSPDDINEILQNVLKRNSHSVEKCYTNEKRPFSTIDWVAM